MNDLLAIVGLTAATFAATNLDNLGMLIALFSDRAFRSRDILLGYVAAAVIVAGVAYTAAKGVELLPVGYLGLLGLIPIWLGITRLRGLFRTRPGPDEAATRVRAGAVPVALMMLAQSADSFGVYVSVFADTRDDLEILILLTVGACVVLWCVAARWLARKSALALPLERWSRIVVPILLIVVGVYILLDTGTDMGPIAGLP
jgi:cadmium resistance protein CadD (predicted permease)